MFKSNEGTPDRVLQLEGFNCSGIHVGVVIYPFHSPIKIIFMPMFNKSDLVSFKFIPPLTPNGFLENLGFPNDEMTTMSVSFTLSFNLYAITVAYSSGDLVLGSNTLPTIKVLNFGVLLWAEYRKIGAIL